MSVTLVELLTVARKIKGITIKDVERATGIHNTTVNKMEVHKNEPLFTTAVKLCNLYGLDIQVLAKTVDCNRKVRR